jgi:hypothetical protein
VPRRRRKVAESRNFVRLRSVERHLHLDSINEEAMLRPEVSVETYLDSRGRG